MTNKRGKGEIQGSFPFATLSGQDDGVWWVVEEPVRVHVRTQIPFGNDK
jgi:hypothetical protein